MEYEIRLTARAKQDLSLLPDWAQMLMESHLVELAQSPSTLSRPVVSPPYAPGGMIFEFDHGPIGTTLYHFVVFFRYGQDETELVVHGIGHSDLLTSG